MSEKSPKSKMVRPNIDARVEIEIVDKDGKVIDRYEKRSESFLKAFLQWLRTFFGGTETIYGPSVGETFDIPGTPTSWFDVLDIRGTAGDDSVGIVVGSSGVAPTPTDTALASKISHGTGAGQLQYSDQTVEAISQSGNTVSFRISRSFTNGSGSSVTVAEAGIMAKVLAADGVTHSFLIMRDVISPERSIPDGATLTIRYTIQVTT